MYMHGYVDTHSYTLLLKPQSKYKAPFLTQNAS